MNNDPNEFLIPTPENTASALHDIAEQVAASDISRGAFIGLSRREDGTQYFPQICAINMNEEELLSLLESSKFLLLKNMYDRGGNA